MKIVVAVLKGNEHLIIDPETLAGKPIIKGTGLAVAFILDLMAKGWSEQKLLENYPTLMAEGIRACLWYAGQVIGSEHVYPSASL